MKKFLTILSSLGLILTTSVSVISCENITNKTESKNDNKNINLNEWTEKNTNLGEIEIPGNTTLPTIEQIIKAVNDRNSLNLEHGKDIDVEKITETGATLVAIEKPKTEKDNLDDSLKVSGSVQVNYNLIFGLRKLSLEITNIANWYYPTSTTESKIVDQSGVLNGEWNQLQQENMFKNTYGLELDEFKLIADQTLITSENGAKWFNLTIVLNSNKYLKETFKIKVFTKRIELDNSGDLLDEASPNLENPFEDKDITQIDFNFIRNHESIREWFRTVTLMTQPKIKIIKDENGNEFKIEEKDENGKTIEIPVIDENGNMKATVKNDIFTTADHNIASFEYLQITNVALIDESNTYHAIVNLNTPLGVDDYGTTIYRQIYLTKIDYDRLNNYITSILTLKIDSKLVKDLKRVIKTTNLGTITLEKPSLTTDDILDAINKVNKELELTKNDISITLNIDNKSAIVRANDLTKFKGEVVVDFVVN